MLRVALVWQGEMMADHMAAADTPITLGTSAGSTFVVPLLRLGDGFAVLRRDRDHWNLALAAGMGGTLHRGGELRDVAELVDGHVAGAVQLVPLGERDWGVLELAGPSGLQLFFQFVEDEAPLPRSRARWDLLTPALAFALLLHAALLVATYHFDDGINPMAYPGERRMTGDFLVQRIKVPPEPATPQPGTAPSQPPTAPPTGNPDDGGGAPGAGEPEAGELVDPTRVRPAPPAAIEPPDAGLMRRPNRAILDRVIGHDLTPALGKFLALPGKRGGPQRYGVGPGTRPGPGHGPGVGPGEGPRRPGPPGRPGPINDIGPLRDRTTGPGDDPAEVEVKLLPPETDAPILTREEIAKVVASRAGLIRACYQRGADRRPGLTGTITVRFTIAPDGSVTQRRVVSATSTLDDAAVEECVLRHIGRLVFPAKGGGNVTFPFRFKGG